MHKTNQQMLLINIGCKYGRLGGTIYKNIVHSLLVSHEKKDEPLKNLLHIYILKNFMCLLHVSHEKITKKCATSACLQTQYKQTKCI
jgi:hypothetical protein